MKATDNELLKTDWTILFFHNGALQQGVSSHESDDGNLDRDNADAKAELEKNQDDTDAKAGHFDAFMKDNSKRENDEARECSMFFISEEFWETPGKIYIMTVGRLKNSSYNKTRQSQRIDCIIIL